MSIETERMVLRPLTMADAEDVFAYSRDPEVGPRAGWEPHANIEATYEVMQTVFIGQPHVFGMELRATNTVVGSVGLLPDPRRENDEVLMIGYALSRAWWGQGLMTEAVAALLRYAFDEINPALTAVTSYTYPFNKPSQRVLEKNGFVFEASLSLAEKRYDGEVFGNDFFLLTRERYELLQSAIGV